MMNKKIIMSFLVVSAFLYACTKHVSPTPVTSDPAAETATAVAEALISAAEATATAVALQTAGPAAQQTATVQAQATQTEQAVQTSTAAAGTPTFTRTATITVATATNTPEDHGFRMTSCNMYDSLDALQMSMTCSYATGATPSAVSADYYSSGALMMSMSYTLDINGNTVSATVTDGSSSVVMSMSSQTVGGVVTRTDVIQSGTSAGYILYQYNADGKPSVIDMYDPSGVQISSQVIQYNALGQPERIDVYSGSSLTLASSQVTYYDAAGRVVRLEIYQGTALYSYVTTLYDSHGNVTQKITYDGTGTATNTENYTNTYDSNGWLINIHAASGSISMDTAITNDSYGNMTEMISSSGGTANMRVTVTWESY